MWNHWTSEEIGFCFSYHGCLGSWIDLLLMWVIFLISTWVPHRCHFATFKQCQEWVKRLNKAIAPPSRLEDLFALAYHAWCLGGSADDEDQHVHLCRPGATQTTVKLELYADIWVPFQTCVRACSINQPSFCLKMLSVSIFYVCRWSCPSENGNGGQEDGLWHAKHLESVRHKLQLQVYYKCFAMYSITPLLLQRSVLWL